MTRKDEVIQKLKQQAKDLMVDWPSSYDKQKKFIYEYINNGFEDGKKAAINAGYSVKSAKTIASNMLTGVGTYSHIPPVVEELKNNFNDIQLELSLLSMVEIQQFWARIIRGEEKDIKLVGVGEGAQIVEEVPADLSVKLQASDKYAKSLGGYVQNVDITQRTIEISVGEWDEED